MSTGGAHVVREVSLYLDRHWDPIGVYSGPVDDDWPAGEYEQYAAHVVELLQRGETAAGISQYLADQATRSMGVPPGPTRAVAERLHRWWHEGGGAPLDGAPVDT